MSAVAKEEKRGAYRAMHACPTHSIRLETPDPIARDALKDFPFPVDTDRLPGTYTRGRKNLASSGSSCAPFDMISARN